MLALIMFASLAQASGHVAEPAALSGTIRNEDNQPISGALVLIRTAGPRQGVGELCPSCYPDCAKRARTDAEGKFVLKDLDPKLVFRLLVAAEGYTPIAPGPIDPEKGPAAWALRRHDLDRRDPTLVLRGSVLDENKNPVQHAAVRPFAIKNGERSWLQGALKGVADPLAVTNDKGEFRLGVTQKDTPLCVEVEAPFLAPLKSRPLVPGPQVHDLKLVAGATVRGKVLKDGKPVPGVTLLLGSTREKPDLGPNPGPPLSFLLRIDTDAQGQFLFSNVPANREYLLLGLMASCHPHGFLPQQRVQIGDSGTSEELGELAMRPGHRLSGRLVMPDGQPPPAGTRVYLTLGGDRVVILDGQQAAVAADGSFAFTGLPAGRYSLEVRTKGYHVSKKNRSYDLLSLYNQITGKVDGDLSGLQVLLEQGRPLPLPTDRELRGLPRQELARYLEEYQRRLACPLQGVSAD